MDGYKAFNEDMTNRYGMKFLEGEKYSVSGKASFGLKGNGFHFCKNIEDTFRYVDGKHCKIASVTSFGDIVSYFDDYNGYYDMYSSTGIIIKHILSREEIIDLIINKNNLFSVYRFLSTGFTPTSDELRRIREKFCYSQDLESYIDYYVNGNDKAFLNKVKKL